MPCGRPPQPTRRHRPGRVPRRVPCRVRQGNARDGGWSLRGPDPFGYNPSVVILSTALLACTAWPRYAHLPVDTADRIPAGASRSPTAPAVAWSVVQPLAEPGDDDPTTLTPEVVRTGKGNALATTLVGTGWNYIDTPTRQEACEDISAFPPEDRGYYEGDVDWRLLDIGATGVLCSGMYGEDPRAQIDVLLYEINPCGLPIAPLRYTSGEDAGRIVGYGTGGPVNVWAVPVEGPMRLAVVAAGWDPTDLETQVNYKWGVSLQAPDDNPDVDADLCAAPPGAAVPEEGG